MLVDLLLIAILFLFGFFALKKGFIASLLSVAGVFLALVLAFLLTKPVVASLVGSSVEGFFLTKVTSSLSSLGGIMVSAIPSEAALLETLSLSMPAFLAKLISSSIGGQLGSYQNQTVAELVSPFLTNLLMNIIIFIVLFIGFIIVFQIVKVFFKGVTSLPLIKQVDQLLGFIFGIVKGLLFVSIAFLLFDLFMTATFYPVVISKIDSSYLTKFLHDNNILLTILSAIFP